MARMKQPQDRYHEIFEYYCTLGLIKHRKFSPEMRAAIDKARRLGNYSWKELKILLSRHAQIVNLTKSNEFPVRPRPLAVFFGQKVYNGSTLICSDYADDGQKWLIYKNGNPSKQEMRRHAFDRPTENYDHLAYDPFADNALE